MIPFRMDEHEELLGADYAEHNIHHPGVGVTRGGRRSSLLNLTLNA